MKNKINKKNAKLHTEPSPQDCWKEPDVFYVLTAGVG